MGGGIIELAYSNNESTIKNNIYGEPNINKNHQDLYCNPKVFLKKYCKNI